MPLRLAVRPKLIGATLTSGMKWCIAVAALAFAASASGAPVSETACSTHGLPASAGVRISRLVAEGLSCEKARSIAQQVAKQVAKGKSIAVPGTSGLSFSTQMTCNGSCKTETQVGLQFPRGKVTVTLQGGKGGSFNFGGSGGGGSGDTSPFTGPSKVV